MTANLDGYAEENRTEFLLYALVNLKLK